MKSISILIKPASQKCNMNCKYCFYHDIADERNTKDFGWISEITYKNIIDKSIDYIDNGEINFTFQGGEPTLIGVDFYINFTKYVKEKNIKNNRINYALQTNGLLIDQNFCDCFKENKFLIGLSIDGPKKLNDINRVDYLNEGTYVKVLQSANMLKKNSIPFNILTVITKMNSSKVSELLKFYEKNKFNYIQFIPCLDIKQNNDDYVLTPKLYGDFLKESFDYYYEKHLEKNFISERFFDNILMMYLKCEPESCMQQGHCSQHLVVESNGDVYTCDFYTYEEYKIGNFNIDSITDMKNSEISKNFIKNSFDVSEKCKKCKYFNLCRGGCKKYKIAEENLQIYCQSYYDFFEYAQPKLLKLTKEIIKRKSK